MAPSLWRILFSKKKPISVTDGSDQPDWSDLHPDLIRLISHKLTDISDFVRFRVVCKSWRRAVQASDLAPQLPWILDYHLGFDRGELRFHSIFTGKTYTISAPQYCKYYGFSYRCLLGSAYNYIPVYDRKTHQCSFFNPLTNEVLSLPAVPLSIISPSCVPCVQLLSSSDQSSRYVCISNNSMERGTCLLACQLGDLNWRIIKYPSCPEIGYRSLPSHQMNTGFAFYNEMCYANDGDTRNTMVINLATMTVVCAVPKPETELSAIIWLVVSFGEILRVCQLHWGAYAHFDIYRLEISKRDGNMTHPYWIKIDNIYNQFLFLYMDHGCAFRADDFPGFVGNCIYYLSQEAVDRTQIYRYDMKDGKIKIFQMPITLDHCWFVPSLCKQSSNYGSSN